MLCKECDEFRLTTSTNTTSASTAKQSAPAAISVANSSSTTTTTTGSIQPSSTSGSPAAAPRLVANELLFFLVNKYDSQPRSSLQSIMSEFFQEEEVTTAKKLLIQCINITQLPSTQSFTRKRVGENKLDRSIDDILHIFSVIDENDVRGLLPTFCAVSLARVLEADRISVSVSAPKLPEAQFRLRFRSRSQGREFRFRPKLNSGRPKLAETGLLTSDVLVLACTKYKPGLYQHPTVGYTGEAARQRGGRVHCCTNDGQCGATATPHTAAGCSCNPTSPIWACASPHRDSHCLHDHIAMYSHYSTAVCIKLAALQSV